MSSLRPFVLAAALLAPTVSRADAVDVDIDGDGDVDADDQRLLDEAEQIEIVEKTEGQQLRESARAVTVIDTRVARERTADLGEVLARAQGVHVRRAGGLGSSTRLSLNGLYDSQIEVFLDGVPLELAGWGLGLANVPVEMVQRIDVHRGVVPISLGADALGGAIDLVTDPSWVNRAAASYQVGSFGMHRATLSGRARDPDTGAAVELVMFVDQAENDYAVDVEVADAQGRVSQVRVPRFHDAYRAAGASAEVGIVRRGPVERALLRLYMTDYEKELQHNTVMTVPYGEATYGGITRGGTFEAALGSGPWQARLVAGLARRDIDFKDVAEHVYDWFGAQIRDRARPGELGEPSWQRVRETGVFARLVAERTFGSRQTLRVSVAPTLATRAGTDLLHDATMGRDPLSAQRDLVQIVNGVEHEVRLGEDRLQNIAFAKHYGIVLDAEDYTFNGMFVPMSRSRHELGFGDLVRYAVSDRVIAKASYEWATRLPSVDEVFGDGILVRPNLAIEPERSHNANLGGRFEDDTRAGNVVLDVNAFARLTDQMIILLNSDRTFVYQNVYAARIFGVDAGASWTAPGGWASVEGSLTVQDIRNASDQGTFGDFEGDRIPNRPWLLAAIAPSVRGRDLIRDGDELVLFANSRYVHAYYRGWESVGARDSKQVIATQLVHGAGLTYAARGATPVVTTVEVQNLLDARVFDSFGVQRPGRALFVKMSVEL